MGLLYVFVVADWLGRREEKRLARTSDRASERLVERTLSAEELRPAAASPVLAQPGAHPRVVAGMTSGVVEPVVVFMLGTAVALVLNYPHSTSSGHGSTPTPGPR